MIKIDRTWQEVCQAQGWEVYDWDDDNTFICRNLPYGVEYCVHIDGHFGKETIIEEADAFDVDEFVAEMLEKRKRNALIPKSVEALQEDGKWMKMLLNLLKVELFYIE